MSGDFRFRSLFISDLSVDVTEAMLLNEFSPFGPIVSVRIVRNRENRQSLGYGYVNYMHESDARNALNSKNFSTIKGRPIRVTPAQSNPSLRRTNKANVFVKNLDKSVDNKRFHDTFRRFGPILSCKLAEEPNGVSKGFGFIQFESEQNAIDAINTMNGRLLDGKILFCSKFLPKPEREKYVRNATEVKKYANIYIKNLSPDFNDNILKEVFITFGPIIAVRVFHKDSKHFGFVCFADSMTANNAVKVLNGKPLPNGCHIYMSRAFKIVPKKSQNLLKQKMTQKRCDGRDIYVKYLDNFINCEELAQIFSPFGQIRRAMTFPPLRLTCDGVGFVSFSSPESAQKAVQYMNNIIIGNKTLFVAIAQPFNERNNSLAKRMSSLSKNSFGYPPLMPSK